MLSVLTDMAGKKQDVKIEALTSVPDANKQNLNQLNISKDVTVIKGESFPDVEHFNSTLLKSSVLYKLCLSIKTRNWA